MLKNFFYACAAILCLVLAYHFGATNAQGQSSLGIPRWVGLGGGSREPFIATDVAIWNYDYGWRTLAQSSHPEPPVPVSQVLFYSPNSVITTSGEAFDWVSGTWVSRGFIPGGPTSATQQTWGQLKAKYR